MLTKYKSIENKIAEIEHQYYIFTDVVLKDESLRPICEAMRDTLYIIKNLIDVELKAFLLLNIGGTIYQIPKEEMKKASIWWEKNVEQHPLGKSPANLKSLGLVYF